MSYPGKAIFMLGVSGAGKNTVISELLKRDLGLTQVISCKTRPLRPEETQDVDFHYMSLEEFQEAIDKGEFLEYAEYAGNMYGTRKKDIIDGLAAGQYIIKELEIQGLMLIAEGDPEIREATRSIFLDIDDETIRKRVEHRATLAWTTMAEEEIAARTKAAKNERELAKRYCTRIIDGTWTIQEETDRVEKCILEILHPVADDV